MGIIIAPTFHASLRINQNYIYKAPNPVNPIIIQYYNVFLFLTLIYLCGLAEGSEELWIIVWKDKENIKGQKFIRPVNIWTLFIDFIENYLGNMYP